MAMEEIGQDVRHETHLRVCDDFRDLMDVLNVVAYCLANVEGDPPPSEIAMLAVASLDDAGYRFVKVIDAPNPQVSDA